MIWIKNVRQTAIMGGAPAELAKWVRDDKVRVYDDWLEAVDHFNRETDYLGNLPESSRAARTWLRFHHEGLNILGESHTYVPLGEVLLAVGSRNFIYEAFAADVLLEGSHLHTAYLAMCGDLLARLGIDPSQGPHHHGAESLFPAMAWGVTQLIPFFDGTYPLRDLCVGNYAGNIAQTGLKMVWGHAKDLAEQGPATTAESALADTVAAHTAELDAYITGLSVNGYLGDSLTRPVNRPKLPALLALASDFAEVMYERIFTDLVITEAQRTTLASLPHETVEDQATVFALWRNLHFAFHVRWAAERGVRYAGMGAEHLAYLRQNGGIPANGHWFDTTPEGLADAIRDTVDKSNPV